VGGWLLRRVGISLVTIVFASIVVFMGVHALPGNPVQTLYGQSGRVSPAQLARLRASYGLNRPLPVQYLNYMWRCLRGNFGTSLASGSSVGQIMLNRLPVTLELAVLSMAFALVVGCAAGILAALRRGKTTDYAIGATALAGLSLPNFWYGLMLILIFGVTLRWLPVGGFISFFTSPLGNLESMILPAVTLGTATAAILMRQMRSAMLESLGADYVRTARAKGLRSAQIVVRHAARNSLTTIVTITGLQLGAVISGVVVVEQLFSLPGFGALLLGSVFARDYPVVEGVTLLTALAYVVINLVVDIVYTVVDPRVRAPGRA
jgi:peptide/nickel transport system permease protein